MSIEEVIDRAVQMNQSIEIEYCTRAGRVFTCRISNIEYSRYYSITRNLQILNSFMEPVSLLMTLLLKKQLL